VTLFFLKTVIISFQQYIPISAIYVLLTGPVKKSSSFQLNPTHICLLKRCANSLSSFTTLGICFVTQPNTTTFLYTQHPSNKVKEQRPIQADYKTCKTDFLLQCKAFRF